MQNNNPGQLALEFSKLVNSINAMIEELEKRNSREYRVSAEYTAIVSAFIEKFPDLESKLNTRIKEAGLIEKSQNDDFVIIAGFLYKPTEMSNSDYKHIDKLRQRLQNFREAHNYNCEYVENKNIDSTENLKLKLRLYYNEMLTQLVSDVSEFKRLKESNSRAILDIRSHLKTNWFSVRNNLTNDDFYAFANYISNIAILRRTCLDFILIASMLKHDFPFFSSIDISNFLSMASIPKIDGNYPNIMSSLFFVESFSKLHFFDYGA